MTVSIPKWNLAWIRKYLGFSRDTISRFINYLNTIATRIFANKKEDRESCEYQSNDNCQFHFHDIIVTKNRPKGDFLMGSHSGRRGSCFIDRSMFYIE